VAILDLPDDVTNGPRNFAIGTTLLGENDRVRIWEIKLAPGERHPFHCHRTSYYWVAHTDARIRATFLDGTVHDYEHRAGEVTYVEIPAGEQDVHDLANTGDTTLVTTTVELLQSDTLFWRPLPAQR
jgi:beta-alanine degradation protein BauB